MFIQKLSVQNFRCFPGSTFIFEKPLVVIQGNNGTGKTTLLEALHYLCFFKSFRPGRMRDLIACDHEHLVVSVDFEEQSGAQHSVQVGLGFENGVQKRLVKFNQKQIKSYQEIISHYRVVSLAEDDMQLVQGAPEHRRSFLNQLLILCNAEGWGYLRTFNQILEQRNKLLVQQNNQRIISYDELEVWTKQLWAQSSLIAQARVKYLNELQDLVQSLLQQHFPDQGLEIKFTYTRKIKLHDSFSDFWIEAKNKTLLDEVRWGRSLFGAHVDDFSIVFQDKRARQFASRGQQKLIVFLLKVALLQKLSSNGIHASFLLDDFLTDFDQSRLEGCLKVLENVTGQVFITCPVESFLNHYCVEHASRIQVIRL